jgi:hypothetical protein
MMITQTFVNVEKVQEILEKYGTTFERPVNLNDFAKEINSCCNTYSLLSTQQSNLNGTAFEVSYTNGN